MELTGIDHERITPHHGLIFMFETILQVFLLNRWDFDSLGETPESPRNDVTTGAQKLEKVHVGIFCTDKNSEKI